MCNYAIYKKYIEGAYSDITKYCSQLQLSDYLIELMQARFKRVDIKYS